MSGHRRTPKALLAALVLLAVIVLASCGEKKGDEETCVYSPRTDRGGQPVDCDDALAIPAEQYEDQEARFQEHLQAFREEVHRREARERAKEARDILSKVCDGTGVPQAATRPTGTLAVFGPLFDVSYRVRAWMPTSLGDAHLVACISDDDQTVEKCQYQVSGSAVGGAGPTKAVERQQQGISVAIREARSGSQVASKTFLGGYPPECPPRLPASENYVLGKDVNPDAVTRWLAQWRRR